MEIRRSVLVPYSAHDMFDLIEQAERYPEFLPWCTGATILERSDDWVAARIEFTYLKFRFGFQTRNPKRRPEWLQVRLVEGPFRHFQAEWLLTPLADIGCKINFAVSYEIIDGAFDRLAAQAVEAVARSMVDAFVKRAEQTLPEFAPAQNAAGGQEQTREQPPAQAEAVVHVAASATAPEEAPGLPPRETTMTTPEPAVIEALRKSRLAQDLTAEQTQVLAGVVKLATFRANETLAVEGTTDNHLYEVVEGSLGVVKHRGTPDETVLVTLQPRDFAHELGFLDGAQRFASLVAATDARVLVLERAGLESLIDTHPRIVYRVMCAIVQTVHRIQTRLSMHATELTNYIVKQHGRY